MILRVDKDYVKKIDAIIGKQIEKKSLNDKDTLLSVVIRNYFTDCNNERKRAKKILDLYLIKDPTINDILGKIKK